MIHGGGNPATVNLRFGYQTPIQNQNPIQSQSQSPIQNQIQNQTPVKIECQATEMIISR